LRGSVKKLYYVANAESEVLAERELDLFILGVRVAVFVTFCCQKVSEKSLVAKPV